jgi:hypothetical protein
LLYIGKAMADRMAMIATVTMTSINVKPAASPFGDWFDLAPMR